MRIAADAIVPIAESRELAAQELLELEETGRVPTMMRPDEVVAAIRERFEP